MHGSIKHSDTAATKLFILSSLIPTVTFASSERPSAEINRAMPESVPPVSQILESQSTSTPAHLMPGQTIVTPAQVHTVTLPDNSTDTMMDDPPQEDAETIADEEHGAGESDGTHGTQGRLTYQEARFKHTIQRHPVFWLVDGTLFVYVSSYIYTLSTHAHNNRLCRLRARCFESTNPSLPCSPSSSTAFSPCQRVNT